MKVFINLIITIVVLSGCAGKEPTPTQCPKFTKKVDIEILYLDDGYAKLSWEDVERLKELGAAIRLFNNHIEELNDQ